MAFTDVLQVLKFVSDSIRKGQTNKRRKAGAAAKYYFEISSCINRMADAFEKQEFPRAECAQLRLHADHLGPILENLGIDDEGIKWMKQQVFDRSSGLPTSANRLISIFGVKERTDINSVALKNGTTWSGGNPEQGEIQLISVVEDLRTVAGQVRALAVELETYN
ncbi:MAG: hypothetical protein RLN90_10355 [Balneolaceae bacterium]